MPTTVRARTHIRWTELSYREAVVDGAYEFNPDSDDPDDYLVETGAYDVAVETHGGLAENSIEVDVEIITSPSGPVDYEISKHTIGAVLDKWDAIQNGSWAHGKPSSDDFLRAAINTVGPPRFSPSDDRVHALVLEYGDAFDAMSAAGTPLGLLARWVCVMVLQSAAEQKRPQQPAPAQAQPATSDTREYL